MPRKIYEPKGIRFFDVGHGNREMIILAESERHAGWLCYRHPDGEWVTLREATAEDRKVVER